MALDLHKTARQVSAMSQALAEGHDARAARLHSAAGRLRDPLRQGHLALEVLKERVSAARPGKQRKVIWPVGSLPATWNGTNLAQCYAASPAPAEYVVLACDGSQIEADSHASVQCFLINIAGMQIRYGMGSGATSWDTPHLYAKPEDLVITDPDNPLRQTPIDATLLAVMRNIMECQALVARVEAIGSTLPVLALLDGTLILRDLLGERYPDHVRARLLDQDFLQALDALREMSQFRPLVFASYISQSRSKDVIGILRVSECPYDAVLSQGCNDICGGSASGKPACDNVADGLTDRDLFEQVLQPGERSEVFASQSAIVLDKYGKHQVHFCYVNVGDEIVRLEMPKCVAENQDSLELLHSLVIDQCRKGAGYPVALQEAHERVVVTTGDQRAFQTLIERSLAVHNIALDRSKKARSKRVPRL